jgi:hypothetical protein
MSDIKEVVPEVGIPDMPPLPDSSPTIVEYDWRPKQAEADFSFVLEEFARHRARGQMK